MNRTTNPNARIVPTRIRPVPRSTDANREPSADLVEVTSKLFDGLRDHPEVRKLIVSILEARPDEPICPTCGQVLTPAH